MGKHKGNEIGLRKTRKCDDMKSLLVWNMGLPELFSLVCYMGPTWGCFVVPLSALRIGSVPVNAGGWMNEWMNDLFPELATGWILPMGTRELLYNHIHLMLTADSFEDLTCGGREARAVSIQPGPMWPDYRLLRRVNNIIQKNLSLGTIWKGHWHRKLLAIWSVLLFYKKIYTYLW